MRAPVVRPARLARITAGGALFAVAQDRDARGEDATLDPPVRREPRAPGLPERQIVLAGAARVGMALDQDLGPRPANQPARVGIEDPRVLGRSSARSKSKCTSRSAAASLNRAGRAASGTWWRRRADARAVAPRAHAAARPPRARCLPAGARVTAGSGRIRPGIHRGSGGTPSQGDAEAGGDDQDLSSTRRDMTGPPLGCRGRRPRSALQLRTPGPVRLECARC